MRRERVGVEWFEGYAYVPQIQDLRGQCFLNNYLCRVSWDSRPGGAARRHSQRELDRRALPLRRKNPMVQNVSCLAFLYRPVLTDGLTLGKRRENGEQEEVTIFSPSNPYCSSEGDRKASIGKEVTTCFFLTLTATRRPEICLAHFCRFCGSLDVTGQPCRQVSKRGTI